MFTILIGKFQLKFRIFRANKLAKENLNLSHFLIAMFHFRIMKYLEFDLLVALKRIVELESFSIGRVIITLNYLCLPDLNKIFF